MNDIRWPNFLKSGDRVALIATARHAKAEDIQKGVTYLESWGLKVVQADNLSQQHFIFAGTESARRHALQKAIDDPSIKAIFCLRGGNGTHRLIDFIHLKNLKKHPKWIIGYSDVTVLLNHVAQYRIPSIHGPMPFSMYKEEEKEGATTLRELLFGKLPEYTFSSHALNQQGVAEGKLIGGNLAVLHSLISTPSDITWKNKILFIEEVDEYIYHLDRMLYHFSRTGRMKGLAGLVVGHLTSMKDNAEPFGLSAREVIARVVKPYKIPLAFSFPAGHELPNMPLIIGGMARLEVTAEKSFLTFKK
ncbi:MAG: muramoyltetrapeptide carboxypeptidase [Chitinophagaceae bacterium]|nr:muramoyltetrapeptide carboxypeptidase [Chitinophagaceae bacterium]